MVDDLRGKLGSGVVLLAGGEEGKVSLALGVTKDLTGRFKAGDLIREMAQIVGGKAAAGRTSPRPAARTPRARRGLRAPLRPGRRAR